MYCLRFGVHSLQGFVLKGLSDLAVNRKPIGFEVNCHSARSRRIWKIVEMRYWIDKFLCTDLPVEETERFGET